MISKKAALSGTLIVLFLLYGIIQRQEGASSASQVVAPNFAALSTAATPTPTATPTTSGSTSVIPTSTPTPSASPTATGRYKDGTYTGSVADAYYGSVQVQATIKNGKITAVTFLQYPNDRGTSIQINSQAMPYLQQEAIIAQSAKVDGVSGASDTSQAFIESLSAALAKAS